MFVSQNIKQEEWDEKMKLSKLLPLLMPCYGELTLLSLGNQFRGIDEEDSAFLADMQNKKLQEERLRKEREAEELALFKAFVGPFSMYYKVADTLLLT